MKIIGHSIVIRKRRYRYECYVQLPGGAFILLGTFDTEQLAQEYASTYLLAAA